MGVFYLISLTVIISVTKSENTCVDNITNKLGDQFNVNSDYNCKTEYCIPKCCAENEYMDTNETIPKCSKVINNETTLNPHVAVYKVSDGKTVRSGLSLTDANVEIVHNAKFKQENCSFKSMMRLEFEMFENASLIFNALGKIVYVSNKDYCMDRTIVNNNGKHLSVFFFRYLNTAKNVSLEGDLKKKYGAVRNNMPKKINCTNRFRDIEDKFDINITEYCKNTHCVAKCCRLKDRIIFYDKKSMKGGCMLISDIEKNTNMSINGIYSKIKIYKSDIERKVELSNISLETHFRFIMNKKMSTQTCSSNIPEKPMEHYYILENNTLVLEQPNYYKRFVRHWEMGEFCMEHLVIRTEDGKVQEPFIVYRYTNESRQHAKIEDKDGTEEILKSIAMLTSCVFLLLVLFVYGVIRDMRNLVGMVLMAYVGTLAITFFFKAVELLAVYMETMGSEVCKRMSVFLYYTTLSSFFWINVMSLDIWWTFRGIFKSRPIHRRGEMVKFAWYALYSWGTPLLVAIAVGVIDFTDLTHMPHIFKPHFEYCFYIKGNLIEMRYYLYLPIFILLIIDWIFFLMTAFNIWRIRKSMAKFANEANKYNNNQNRFGLYLKLSLVMGISWVLEMLELPWWLQSVATAYNSLFGVAIFFIYVFKRKVLFKLCKRFGVKSNYIENLQRNYSKYSTTATVSNAERKRSDIELTLSTTQGNI